VHLRDRHLDGRIADLLQGQITKIRIQPFVEAVLPLDSVAGMMGLRLRFID